MLVLLIGLTGALARSQLAQADQARAKELRQSLRQLALPAPRGVIYDRRGRVLAGARPQTDVVLHLGRLPLQEAGPDTPALEEQAAVEFARVAALLGRSEGFPQERWKQHLARQRVLPFVLVADMSAVERERLATALSAEDPVQLEERTVRAYPHGATAAHVLGRLRSETVRTPVGQEYPILNYIAPVGVDGIEQALEERLAGRPGHEVVRVDARGLRVGEPRERMEPVAGEGVRLSLDLDVQRAAEGAFDAMVGHPRGAAVALDVETGEVLAMVSRPTYDLGATSPVLTMDLHRQVEEAGGWLNRATQGLYPPGSAFKVVTTLAALRSGAITPDTVEVCPGYHDVGGHRFTCHVAEGHGEVGVVEALAHSCNVFAYRAGLAAGPMALAEEARRFGLDQPTGLDVGPETTRMLVPDPAWKLETGRGEWMPGDTVNLAIGQGFLCITPLQAASLMASLARREAVTVPTLLYQPGRSPSGDRPRIALDLGERDYAALIRGMRAVVEHGIGARAQVPGVSVAGKTGTAQVTRADGPANVAWMIAFAPIDRPRVAVAVAIEAPEADVEFTGAEHAAPVVREIIASRLTKA